MSAGGGGEAGEGKEVSTPRENILSITAMKHRVEDGANYTVFKVSVGQIGVNATLEYRLYDKQHTLIGVHPTPQAARDHWLTIEPKP